MYASVFSACVKSRRGRLEFYLFSDRLPPLFSTKRKAEEVFSALSRVFGYACEGTAKTIVIKPLYVPAVLTWIVASLTTNPRVELLEELVKGTPRSALELIFESIDAGRAYREKRPLIPEPKLAKVSRKVARIMGLSSEDKAYRRGVLR